MIETVVDKCLEDVKSGAVPDAHHTVTQDHRIWDLLTDSGTELKLSAVPGLQINFDMRLINPRTFSAAVGSGNLMALAEVNAAHDQVHPMLGKWHKAIITCNRWLDGYRDDKCSVLRELAQEGGFGYTGLLDSKLIIDWHVRAFPLIFSKCYWTPS